MEQVRQSFGDAFTAYCLNTASESLDSTALTEGQVEAIEVLTPIAEASLADPNELTGRLILSRVLEYQKAGQTSLANMLRMHCGGTLPVVNSSNPVERALLTIGRDVFAVCLLPEPRGPMLGFPIMSIPIFGHPQAKEMAQAILADSALSKLFPNHPDPETYTGDGTEVHSMVQWSNGSGGSLQLLMLVNSLLSVGLNGLSKTPTYEEYSKVLQQALGMALKLANKKITRVPALVGLTNVELTDNKSVTFPGGELRQPTAGDRRSLMNAENVTVVLEVEAPLKLLSVRHWEPGSNIEDRATSWEHARPTLEKFQQELRRNVDLARLSMLFASPEGDIVAPAEVATAVINPLASGQSVGLSPFRHPIAAFGNSAITAEISVKIQKWAAKVASHPASLDMAMRRLLSSVSTRLDPMDGFVDAVICWENMFGTGEGEVGFRVAGAIAKLLEPDDAATRKKLFDEVRGLYGIRSKLVHGSKEPKYQDAVVQRNRSVEIAVQALQRLYDRPEILAAGDSSVRGRMLLLDA